MSKVEELGGKWQAELQERFRVLERREQIAVIALGIFFAGLVLSYGLWIPLSDFAADAAARYENRVELLSFMKSTESAARARSSTDIAVRSSDQNLLRIVSTVSQQSGVKPTRLQPQGEDQVSVWFENVEFNALLVWMDRLKNQGVNISQLYIDRQKAVGGKVTARAVLR